ncbi:MAG TPA: LacI family DNA-binding transcriptional regulator [Phototrophicaceae bacterium]|nr:LacI family DNA-binding transcriptional regulator [Phototrophicaceae bacterium]
MANEKNSPPTIYDVATLAGLSIATVSRVLNSPERVSEASRRKVMEAIDQLGFVPSAEARARTLQSTARIGVITPFFTSPSFTDRLRGVASALANSRYELVIYTVDSMDRLDGYLSSLPLTGNLDGLILISLPLDDAAAQRLRANELPTVLIEYAYLGFSGIVIDDRAGGQMAAQHLIEQGHRRCAYVYFGESPEYSIHPEVPRLAGFRQALAEHGLALPDEYVKYVPISRRGIREKLRELFDLPEPPTAIFAPSDDLAIRIIHRAHELGLSCPRDISVIGFDNIDIAEHVDLTTISQGLVESGQIAVQELLARLNDPHRPVQQIHIQLHLEERGTIRKLD